MLPETVMKIRELVLAGARVVATAPVSPATLRDEDGRFTEAVNSLWGNAPEGRVTRIGKGYLAVGMSLDDALKAFGLRPHLVCEDKDLIWFERKTEGARWYFVAAPVGKEFHGTVRVLGRGRAQWWNPVDGSVKSLRTRGIGRFRKVRLDLELAEGGFIVFRQDAGVVAPAGKAFAQFPSSGVVEISDWTVSFPEGWGAPTGPVAVKGLAPWKDLDLGEEGRAFSGTAAYSATFDIPARKDGKDVVLDLGSVDFIADVKVNGESAGVLWTAPYRISVGNIVHDGTNTLTVDVTGTWYNRLAFDAGKEEAARKTWTINGPEPGSPLHDSGLLGPVRIHY